MNTKTFFKKELIERAKHVDLRALLESFSFQLLQRPNLFENPFRTDRNPSFSVFQASRMGIWIAHDFSTQKVYNNIDFLMEYKGFSFVDAVQYLLNFEGIFSNVDVVHRSPYLEPKELPHLKLCSTEQYNSINYYLKICRAVSPSIAQNYVRYYQYEREAKTYYGLFFRNDSGGYAFRNPYRKMNFGTCDITTIEPKDKDMVDITGEYTGYQDWCVFEGFMDFLSALTYFSATKGKVPKTNFLILNSTSQTKKAITFLLSRIGQEYENRIYCFLDNDDAGKKAIKAFEETFVVYDKSKLYHSHNDFNEFLRSKTYENTQAKSA